jgi:hypothetical protein
MASVRQSLVTDRVHARKLLQDALRAEMAKLGFALRRGIFHRKLNDETTLWVSLQLLKGSGSSLGLFPRVGFINWKVAEFYCRHLDDPVEPAGNVPPTLSATLGYLMPGPARPEWHFECAETAIRMTVKTVVENVAAHGMPFMTRYPDLQSLKAWADDPGIEPEATNVQPQLLRAEIFYLGGDWARAKQVIAANIVEAGDDIADPSYRPILRLSALLDESPHDRAAR